MTYRSVRQGLSSVLRDVSGDHQNSLSLSCYFSDQFKCPRRIQPSYLNPNSSFRKMYEKEMKKKGSLGVPIPETQSVVLQSHHWVVYRLGVMFGPLAHKVKIHEITPTTGKERGDIEIKDYVVLQTPQGQDNRLPPPRTLIMDFTMTHVRFGCSHLHPIGQLTYTTLQTVLLIQMVI